ncbi:MAG: DUF255 domain-containing protein [Bacteroidota bacterium]
MKKIVLGLVLGIMVMSISSFTDGNVDAEKGLVNWYTWEEAVEAAKEEPRKVFVDIYTNWCGWCKKMDKNTFNNPKVAEYLNANYYPVKLNAEQKEDIEFQGHVFKYVPGRGGRGYHQLAGALLEGQLRYPTVIFLNEEFQVMQRFATYLDAPTFDMIQRYLAEPEFNSNMSWEQYQVHYKETQGSK